MGFGPHLEDVIGTDSNTGGLLEDVNMSWRPSLNVNYFYDIKIKAYGEKALSTYFPWGKEIIYRSDYKEIKRPLWATGNNQSGLHLLGGPGYAAYPSVQGPL